MCVHNLNIKLLRIMTYIIACIPQCMTRQISYNDNCINRMFTLYIPGMSNGLSKNIVHDLFLETCGHLKTALTTYD